MWLHTSTAGGHPRRTHGSAKSVALLINRYRTEPTDFTSSRKLRRRPRASCLKCRVCNRRTHRFDSESGFGPIILAPSSTLFLSAAAALLPTTLRIPRPHNPQTIPHRFLSLTLHSPSPPPALAPSKYFLLNHKHMQVSIYSSDAPTSCFKRARIL